MPLFGKSHKSPGEIVRNLREALLLIEKGQERKSEKAVEEINRWLQAIKSIIYGQDNQEPNTEQISQLVQEIYNASVLPMLIRQLTKLDFESKKDVALIFNNLLRRQIGTRSPTVEYLCARPEILMTLVRGYEASEIALTCGTMLRECTRHEHLAKMILLSEQFFDFFRYVESATFDIASDAFSTFKDLITKHKSLCADLLEKQYDRFFECYQKLLLSENYVVRRQSLKLVTNRETFQVFVANPNKPKPITEILLRNRDRLAEFLSEFHSDSIPHFFYIQNGISQRLNEPCGSTIFDDINKAADAPKLIYPLNSQSSAAQPGTSTSAVAAIRDSLHNYRAAAISDVFH
uniref:Protein Mo25 n=1 Tax=Meloidogyne hapla TaxID=6305 RepID=A0A1I8B6C8_MELHA